MHQLPGDARRAEQNAPAPTPAMLPGSPDGFYVHKALAVGGFKGKF
jgi:hypothetical protein